MRDQALGLFLYLRMYKIRYCEEVIIQRYPENDMKVPMHMSMGQEAIAVGICAALEQESQVFASYRSHAAYIAKTDDTDRFFAELYGRATGTGRGKAGSMHLSAPEKGHFGSSGVVASAIPPAVGAAFANKYKKNGQISCVFFGEGALEEGDFWESLNLACVMRLPVLFVCEDNEFAVHTPKNVRQGFRSIPDVLAAFECNVFDAGTTDVEQIYQIGQEAVAMIRRLQRPAFIYHPCYRYLEHVGIDYDFQVGYRSIESYREWLNRDSLDLQRSKLVNGFGYTEDEVVKAERLIQQQVALSVEKARNAPFPGPEELYRDVYSPDGDVDSEGMRG